MVAPSKSSHGALLPTSSSWKLRQASASLTATGGPISSIFFFGVI
jgi:hypothetical protein